MVSGKKWLWLAENSQTVVKHGKIPVKGYVESYCMDPAEIVPV